MNVIRSLLLALLILSLVIGLVVCAAIYISNITDQMLSISKKLPDDPTKVDFSDFGRLSELIEKGKTVIGLCVQDNYLGDMTESFKRMITFAKKGSAEEYSAEKQSFIEAVTHIWEGERISVENLL